MEFVLDFFTLLFIETEIGRRYVFVACEGRRVLKLN